MTRDNILYYNNMTQRWYDNPFLRFLYLSKTKKLPKIVIIESVERYFIERIYDLNYSMTDLEMLSKNLIDTTGDSNSLQIKQRTILEETQEWMKREIGMIGYKNPIKSVTLNKECFTCTHKENKLYFYQDDINQLPTSDSLLYLASIKLDRLFAYADSVGIDLYVLIAADKYDIYQDYIVDNPYPQQNVLERLNAIFPHPKIINSKDTLSNMVEQGVLDVYWCNDTHWSPIGAEAVAKQLAERINQYRNDTIFLMTQ